MDFVTRKKFKPLQDAGVGSESTEKESSSGGVGSKTKPCTKFFSISGCPYGEGCHYLHYVPGGLNVVSEMQKLGNTAGTLSRKTITSSLPPSGKSDVILGYKTRLCNRYGSAEGCQFADKCNFAHGEKELRNENTPANIQQKGLLASFGVPVAAATFGALSKTNINIDASLASGIIGKGGVHTKQIYRLTGVKLVVKDHETDPNLKTVDFEGSFENVQQAINMVRELIKNNEEVRKQTGHISKNLKTKLCENFAKGSCTFGGKCHFAHGASDLH